MAKGHEDFDRGVSLDAQEIAELAVDIVAQTVGNMEIDVAAQTISEQDINIRGQNLSQLVQRPKYGSMTDDHAVNTTLADGNSLSVTSATGPGIFYYAILIAYATADSHLVQPLIGLDAGDLLVGMNYNEIDYYGFGPGTGLFRLLKYGVDSDCVLFVSGVRMTFESSLDISIFNQTGSTQDVEGYAVYSLI